MINSKADRKMYRSFSPAFFSRGTVVEVKNSHGIRIVFEIDKLGKSSPDRYQIQSKELDLDAGGEPMFFGINNVVRIHDRAPGPAMLDFSMNQELYADIMEMQRNFAEKYALTKHKSHYLTESIVDLVMVIADKYVDQWETIDLEKLVEDLFELHIIKFHVVGSWYDQQQYYTVSKKKLNAAIKRLVPRCRLTAKFAQFEYDEEIDEAMAYTPEVAAASAARIERLLGDLDKKVMEGNAFVIDVSSIANIDELNTSLNEPSLKVFGDQPHQLKPPSLGDLLKEKFDRMNEKAIVLEDSDNIEAMLDREEEKLSDSITYVDDGETEDGNFTPDPNKKD